MNDEQSIRDYILDAIADACIHEGHEELKYAIQFTIIFDPSKPIVRFSIDDFPSREDVYFNSLDIETPSFYYDIQNAVHLLIYDYLALPHREPTDIRDHSEDAVDAMRYFIQNGRANGKTAAFKDSKKMARKILADLSGLPENADIQKHAQAIIWGKLPITNNMNEKGNSTMATTEGIKITTDRYVSESEAYYDSELKKIETKLAQDISDAQFEAQKARCELENWLRAERIKEQESEKAQKRKAYYDGLIASGFTGDQALKILLEEL